jgi:TusA-related sulfurtransferase
MNNIIDTIDARGLSCPQPVLLVNRIIKELNKGAIEVLVDSGTARENVGRCATKLGWAVSVEAQPEGIFRMVLRK